MKHLFLSILTLNAIAIGDHDRPLSQPTGNQHRNLVLGTYGSIPLTEAPCIFQATTSPPETNTLNRLRRTKRLAKDIMGPVQLLAACKNMILEVGHHQCKRIFVGGHGVASGVGVGDLFYLSARAALTEPQLREARNRLNSLPNALPASKVAARASIRSGTPCYPGPVSPRITQAAPAQNDIASPPRPAISASLTDNYNSAQPTPVAELDKFDEILNCFETLIDKRDPERALVFSSCGPLENNREGRAQVSNETGPALQQAICGRVLSDAIGLPVKYSNGDNCCFSGRYDTCEMGHREVQPSYWNGVRPNETNPPLPP